MKPLAERMRPVQFEDFVGQSHLIGKGSSFRKAIELGNLHSMLFWGPPGTGKTTLAKMVANISGRDFFQLSAVDSGVKQIREIVERVNDNGLFGKKTPILFIDEIHRFSKNQQDALLGIVEEGKVVLIAATTENPSFEVINPLLSRCQVYVLRHLEENDLKKIVHRALTNDEVLKQYSVEIKEWEALLLASGGDGRKLLNILEMAIGVVEKNLIITNAFVQSLLQQQVSAYDKGGEQHYDIISAFIKSVRGSDVDAAIYWLARMIAGGEDVKFIARRLVILAAEDIGLANPNALLLANACFEAVSKIGYPESRIILSETTIYLATSPKSNSAYIAIDKALEHVKETGDLPVPLALRNAPTNLMKSLNYGKGYKYPHEFDENFVKQNYWPDKLNEKPNFYIPQNNVSEKQIENRQEKRWKK
jgi:putative ATPase